MDGHVKLADFGLSKENFTAESLSMSFCGSPEYMSPEMLSRTGHNKSIDLYSLGALLYEMLTGLPPHYSANRQEMYQSIVSDPVFYPPYVSLSAASLMQGLLRKSAEDRLGARGGIAEIKAHKFFAGVDWDELNARKLPCPNPLDVRRSHFDPEFLAAAISWSQDEAALCDPRPRSQSASECLAHSQTTCGSQEEDEAWKKSDYIRSILVTQVERASDNSHKGKARSPKKRGVLDIKQFFEKPRRAEDPFPGYVYNFKDPVSAPSQYESIVRIQPCKESQKLKTVSGDCEGGEPEVAVVAESGSSSSGNTARRESTGTSRRDPVAPAEVLGKMKRLTVPKVHTRCSSMRSASRNGGAAQKSGEKIGCGGSKFKKESQREKAGQLETSKLIGQCKSKKCAGLIKLNDELVGVVSERKRSRPKQKPHGNPKRVQTRQCARKTDRSYHYATTESANREEAKRVEKKAAGTGKSRDKSCVLDPTDSDEEESYLRRDCSQTKELRPPEKAESSNSPEKHKHPPGKSSSGYVSLQQTLRRLTAKQSSLSSVRKSCQSKESSKALKAVVGHIHSAAQGSPSKAAKKALHSSGCKDMLLIQVRFWTQKDNRPSRDSPRRDSPKRGWSAAIPRLGRRKRSLRGRRRRTRGTTRSAGTTGRSS